MTRVWPSVVLTFQEAAKLGMVQLKTPDNLRQGQDPVFQRLVMSFLSGPQVVSSSEKATHSYFTSAAGPRVLHLK